uniref:Thioredoxin domain-containing protein n=1 Tax=Hemiselmis andersenii TaxID=464988 RepID=A0A6U4YEN9_HEMAN|mmetsp:Transcript_6950/g.15882  ORF Transcript_6950/g.15882 Transcript_6950/m.15882 type:complete len:343 (+) Transcript_6950:27-1055(+)
MRSTLLCLAIAGTAVAFGPTAPLPSSLPSSSLQPALRGAACPPPALVSSVRSGSSLRMQHGEDKEGEEGSSPARLDRRGFAAGIASAAVLLSSAKAEALQWSTVESIMADPSQLAMGLDPAKVTELRNAWKRNNLGVKAANAAQYTVEFDEFVKKVQEAGKAKIDGEVVENPTDEQLLKAWKVEEKRRADKRAAEGKEPLTRPTRVAKEGSKKANDFETKYYPPVVTNASTPETLALGAYLKEIGATMYGAYWCSHCYDQKMALGYEATDKYLDYVECDKKGANGKREFCKERKVKGFPTWEVYGELYPGGLSIAALADLVGFDLETKKKSERGQIKPPPAL